jgi:phosphatidylglycerol:prolipoprotein diacylglycerol transferase
MIEISLDPVMFNIGPLSLGWYGFFILLCFLALVAWVFYITNKEKPGFTTDHVLMAALVVAPATVIGARFFHILDYWDFYTQNPAEIWGFDGLAIWGGLIFGVLALYIYCTLAKVNFFKLADVAVPGLFLAQSIGRLGCLATGCCYGNTTALPFGIVYTHPHSHGYLESTALSEGTGFLPTQVFESIFMLIMFFLFAFVLRKLKWPTGAIFIAYVAVYAFWRVILGFWRSNEAVLFGLSQAQLIGAVLLLIIIPLGYWYIKRSKSRFAGE